MTILYGDFSFYDNTYDDYDKTKGERYTEINNLVGVLTVNNIEGCEIINTLEQGHAYIVLEEYEGNIYLNNIKLERTFEVEKVDIQDKRMFLAERLGDFNMLSDDLINKAYAEVKGYL